MPLTDHVWLPLWSDFETELLQARDEGRDLSAVEPEIARVAALENDAEKNRAVSALFEAVRNQPIKNGGCEPSGLDEIRALRVKNRKAETPPDRLSVEDRVYGAWLGRCAGCLFGKPFEGSRIAQIDGILRETGNYPAKKYVSSDVKPEIVAKYDMDKRFGWINQVECMPEDDDTNYTVLGLALLQNSGFDFTPSSMADFWLSNLPILHVCTAERAAYRNFVMCIDPPESASFHNPYREWIGAQIRADIFGYVTPGNPEAGAELAWRDACISHVKNGIYGEMWVAAMLSQAAVTSDTAEIIRAGMGEIPCGCRLYSALEEVLALHAGGAGFDAFIAHHKRKYDENKGHDWCHTISNAEIVAAALLWGDSDFSGTMHCALVCGFDTDCNCATAGSVLGMALGAKKLPEEWIKPLNDTLLTGVSGYNRCSISDLAEKTVNLIKL